MSMQSSSNENQILITLKAIKQKFKLLVQCAFQIYEIFCTTLKNQHNGIQLKHNIPFNSKNS